MKRSRALLFFSWICLWMSWAAPGLAGEAPEPARAAAARDLEERLLAPCCWRGTLDAHESPLATELRGEIRRRLGTGELAHAIEADLIARYGPRMRATLPEHLGGTLAFALLLGGLGVVLLGWRRLRRGAPGAPPAPGGRPAHDSPDLSPQERRSLEARLDDDLDAAHIW